MERSAPTGIQRAYGLIQVKASSDIGRTFTGIATTVSADRMGDIVESNGAQFKLPLPFLYQHDANSPVGWITNAKVGKSGIEVSGHIESIADAPPTLRERLDVAWSELKNGLVRGLSIGFNPIEFNFIADSYGIHYTAWEWLELSMVTIPANADATIVTVKQFDARSRAASGHTRGVRLVSPGASGTVAAVHRGSIKLIPR